MSKTRHTIAKNRRFFQYSTLSLLIAAVLGASAPAYAAQSLRTEQGRTSIYKAPIADFADISERTLDWRSPEVDVYFDIADSDWIDGLDLLITARPNGTVHSRMPIMVSFNGAKDIPIYTQGQAFDARIKLSEARVRQHRNKVTFKYKTPAGQDCLTEKNGAWTLDFAKSSLVVTSRAKSRSYQIREVENRFKMPATAPKTVTLLARGPHALKLQMLAAQGVGLRSKDIPDFRITQGRTDLEIVMGRRDELKGLVSDKKILADRGARASIHQGRPMRLVLTGDTDAEVLKMAEAFSQHKLPQSRRTQISMGETLMQPSFASKAAVIGKKTKLNTLPGQIIGQDWGTSAQKHVFNVEDPAVSSGRVLLRLSNSRDVSNASTVQVKLNGHDLGYTPLDRLRKSVVFNIPHGTLQATDNTLQILPELARKDTAQACGYDAALPGFFLGDGSKLELRAHGSSPVTELSRFAATGAPFSNNLGEDTVIVMASGSAKNKAAGLKVLAQLAKVNGQSWTNASITTAEQIDTDSYDKNVLVLGPKTGTVDQLFKAGPKSLSAALRGDMLWGDTIFQTASVERFASAGEADVMRLYAARQASKGKITRGGVAALYPSPHNEERVIGVISSSSGQSFESAADQLVTQAHWNQLEGSVTRWNKTEVLMAQTALPETGAMKMARINRANPTSMNVDWAGKLMDGAAKEAKAVTDAAATKFASLRASVKDRLSKPLQAELSVPDAKPAPIKSASIPTPSLKRKPAITPAVKPVQIAEASLTAPQLRGFSKVASSSQDAKTPGFQVPEFKMPELTAPSIDWSGVKAKFDNPIKSVKDTWRALRTDRPNKAGWAKSARHSIKRVTSKGTKAGNNFLSFMDNRMSFPALFVMIAFFILISVLTVASATARTGDHH